jgi:ubiquinone/menaquinone biosynthesis C-methylase UbiE
VNTQIDLNNTDLSPQIFRASAAPRSTRPKDGKYVLATGSAAVRRLLALHEIYAPAGRRLLLKAGLKPGMRVADFGCGVGAVTRMLAEMVGPLGTVNGIDVHAPQLEEAGKICASAGLHNVSFTHADACNTGLPAETIDLVYCRYLLLHLPDPNSCLREMRRVLKPGGLIFVEDGDLASATSIPRTALDAFADLFTRLAPFRGVNYSLSTNLFHMVKAAGFSHPEIEIHQPALSQGESRFLLKWSVEEAAQGFIDAGLITSDQLTHTLDEMHAATIDPEVLVLPPRMSLVWARK